MLVCMQVDDQSVFRHNGERKVKTVEEDIEEVSSRTAELLEEGEELIGRKLQTGLVCLLFITAFKCCT